MLNNLVTTILSPLAGLIASLLADPGPFFKATLDMLYMWQDYALSQNIPGATTILHYFITEMIVGEISPVEIWCIIVGVPIGTGGTGLTGLILYVKHKG